MRLSYLTSTVKLTAMECPPLSSHIRIRPIAPKDCEPLYVIHKEAMRPYVEATWGWDENLQREFWSRTAHERVQIIEWKGERAGYLDVRWHRDHVDIVNIVLGPSFQGRGIGTEIINDILDEACQRHVEVRLQVLKVNPRASDLYRRLGFSVSGETETHILMALPSTQEKA